MNDDDVNAVVLAFGVKVNSVSAIFRGNLLCTSREEEYHRSLAIVEKAGASPER